MATASLSILALYNWCEEQEETGLFEYFDMPETLDGDVLIGNILMQSAPFEAVYPDPDVLRELIGLWSMARVDKWEKWVDSWTKAHEFNQLENFDRAETETIEHSGTDTQGNTQTRNLAGTDNRTANLQDQRTANLQSQRTADLTNQRTDNLSDAETRNLTDGHSGSGTDELTVSAYDVSTYSPKEKHTTSESATDTHTGTDTFTHTGTQTNKETGTDTRNDTGTDTIAHTGTDNRSTSESGTIADQGAFVHGHKIGRQSRYHGNIGVTSLADLLSSYNEAAEAWDVYARITQEFIQEFCVMVY